MSVFVNYDSDWFCCSVVSSPARPPKFTRLNSPILARPPARLNSYWAGENGQIWGSEFGRANVSAVWWIQAGETGRAGGRARFIWCARFCIGGRMGGSYVGGRPPAQSRPLGVVNPPDLAQSRPFSPTCWSKFARSRPIPPILAHLSPPDLAQIRPISPDPARPFSPT